MPVDCGGYAGADDDNAKAAAGKFTRPLDLSTLRLIVDACLADAKSAQAHAAKCEARTAEAYAKGRVQAYQHVLDTLSQ